MLPIDACTGTWPDGPFDDGDPGERAGARVVGEFVRAATAERRRRGWSRRELANRAGLRPNTVGDLEAGKSWPDLRTLAVVAATLDVPVSFTPTPAPPAPENHEPALALVPGPRLTAGAVIAALLNYSPATRADYIAAARRPQPAVRP